MATYVEPGKRQRTLVLSVLAGLVVGIVVGFLIGRSASTSAGDVADHARERGQDAATAFIRLPVEYEQALQARAGESSQSITEAVDSGAVLLTQAYAAAPWLGPGLRQPVDAAVQKLRDDAAAQVPAAQFERDVTAAGQAIGNAFGFEPESS